MAREGKKIVWEEMAKTGSIFWIEAKTYIFGDFRTLQKIEHSVQFCF